MCQFPYLWVLQVGGVGFCNIEEDTFWGTNVSNKRNLSALIELYFECLTRVLLCIPKEQLSGKSLIDS